MSKKILVSSNGKHKEISSTLNEQTGVISSSYIGLQNFTLTGSVGILSIQNGDIGTLPTGTAVNQVLKYTPQNNFEAVSVESLQFSGDISGAVGTNISIKSVQNVTGGILSRQNGGTGVSSVTNNGVLRSDGSSLATSAADKIISVDSSGEFVVVDKSLTNFDLIQKPLVYLYTGSVGTTSASSRVLTWTKPANTRIVKVICQGGGGGGGSGWTLGGDPGQGGGGGGGGGISIMEFNGVDIPSSVSVVAGFGGSGGPGNVANGFNGGSSSFGSYLYAGGGIFGFAPLYFNGGTAVDPVANGGGGGEGYSANGTAGGRGYEHAGSVDTAGTSTSSRIAATGGGGGARGTADVTLCQGKNGGNNGVLIGGLGGNFGPSSGSFNDAYLYYFENYFLNNTPTTGSFPKLLCTGGGGGGGRGPGAGLNGGNGGSPTFGAGGGGGGGKYFLSSDGAVGCGSGGNGGVGYVLIICY